MAEGFGTVVRVGGEGTFRYEEKRLRWQRTDGDNHLYGLGRTIGSSEGRAKNGIKWIFAGDNR